MFCCLCYSSEQEPLKRKNTRGQNVNLDDYDQERAILYPVRSWENGRTGKKVDGHFMWALFVRFNHVFS